MLRVSAVAKRTIINPVIASSDGPTQQRGARIKTLLAPPLPVTSASSNEQDLRPRELPERLLVLGGGPIGCELAQAYAAFGTAVTIVDTATRLVPSEDDVISQAMMRVLQVAGVRLVLNRQSATRTMPSGTCAAEDPRRRRSPP